MHPRRCAWPIARAARRDHDLCVATGRKLIEDALREPMLARGWTPRASGWFTRSLDQGQLGVVGLASEHAAPGTAMVSAYVHLRDEGLEAEVASLGGWPDHGYRTTTATTSIGYLMPDARWHEWHVAPENGDVADEIAQAVHTYAEPHLRGLAEDPRLLLASIRSSPSYTTAVGLARAVVLLGRIGEHAEAGEITSQRLAGLGGRVDPAAAEERRVADLLRDWLAR